MTSNLLGLDENIAAPEQRVKCVVYTRVNLDGLAREGEYFGNLHVEKSRKKRGEIHQQYNCVQYSPEKEMEECVMGR